MTHQVKQLERAIGNASLARAGRGVVLTDAGRRLHAGTTPQLRAIAETAAQLWPRPRRVRVEADSRLADPAGTDWDIAIRQGHGNYPGTESARLFAYDVGPVCAPAYSKRLFGVPNRVLQPTNAAGWASARLLHETCHPCWPGWLQRAGIPSADSAGALHFSHVALVIAAAVDGQGVALVPRHCIESELAATSLVMLDARPYQTGVGLHAVWPSGRQAVS